MGSFQSIPAPTITEELFHEIGSYVKLDMNTYSGKIVFYNYTYYLIYSVKDNSHRRRSIYTVDLNCLKPTYRSPIQTPLPESLIKKLQAALGAKQPQESKPQMIQPQTQPQTQQQQQPQQQHQQLIDLFELCDDTEFHPI